MRVSGTLSSIAGSIRSARIATGSAALTTARASKRATPKRSTSSRTTTAIVTAAATKQIGYRFPSGRPAEQSAGLLVFYVTHLEILCLTVRQILDGKSADDEFEVSDLFWLAIYALRMALPNYLMTQIYQTQNST